MRHVRRRYVDPNAPYEHRGVAMRRRRRRMQKIAVGVASAALLGGVLAMREPPEARATPADVPFYVRGEARRLQEELARTTGELNLATAQLDRATRIIEYSSRYDISADLAGDIYDIALAEGIDPALAFRLVQIESNFNERATSPVGAIGLAQVMPATAQYFERGITRDRLYDRTTNLRIGFRYLRTLVREQRGDVRMALLIYNRGPVAVRSSIEAGRDPANGYAQIVMKGYQGRGTVD